MTTTNLTSDEELTTGERVVRDWLNPATGARNAVAIDCVALAQDKEQMAQRIDEALSRTATRMRDKCVAKVREMGEQWRQQRAREKRDMMEHAAMMCSAKAEAAFEVTCELESLTLDQVEQETK